MLRAMIAVLFTVILLESASYSEEAKTHQSPLGRLKNFGYLVTDDGIGEHSPRIVVPHDSTVTVEAIEELMQYCIQASPKAEVVFLGPSVVEEQLRQFRQILPNAEIRHMSVVWLGAIFRHCHDDGINDICRIEGLERGSPAAQLGLQKDDIILGVGEYRWPEANSLDSFALAMKRQVPGEETTIIVKRGNEFLSFPVSWRTLPKSRASLHNPR